MQLVLIVAILATILQKVAAMKFAVFTATNTIYVKINGVQYDLGVGDTSRVKFLAKPEMDDGLAFRVNVKYFATRVPVPFVAGSRVYYKTAEGGHEIDLISSTDTYFYMSSMSPSLPLQPFNVYDSKGNAYPHLAEATRVLGSFVDNAQLSTINVPQIQAPTAYFLKKPETPDTTPEDFTRLVQPELYYVFHTK